jgi:signal transduction histidine kinase
MAEVHPAAYARGVRSLGRVLSRPVRGAAWRDTAYLVLGLGTSILAFVVLVAGGTVGGVLAITIVGLPVLFGVVLAARGVAFLERRRTAFELGRPVPARYRSAPNERFLRRLWVALSDPATWKDLAWLLLLSVIGFGFAVAAITLWAVVLWALTLPIYWWALPPAAQPELGPDQRVDSWQLALLVAAAGVPAAVIVAWIVAGLAQVQARLAELLLRPGRRAALERRVSELTETRAGAVDAQAAELQRIERDLHDGAQARLVALGLDLGLAREKLEDQPEAARALVVSAHEEAKTALAELRDLVRGIHPAILSDRGLDAALSAVAARTPVPVSVQVELDRRLPAALEATAYFVVSEALANVAKHSGATRSTVRIARRDGMLTIAVSDDGRGGADPGQGSGIAGLERRVRALDGTLGVTSPDGGPTTVYAELPCGS